jgi:AcrR family transcriptional regulator
MKEQTGIKERILEVSTQLFAEKGFDGVSIDEIAKVAKVNKSMIYYYFSSKEGMLISLIQLHLAEFEAFIGMAKLKKSRDIRSLVRELMSFVVQYMTAHADVISILFHETLLKTPKTKVDIVTFINPLWDKIEKSVRATHPDMTEASQVDKLLCISVIISFIIIQTRMEGLDSAARADAQELYIQRVTSIITALITEPADEA